MQENPNNNTGKVKGAPWVALGLLLILGAFVFGDFLLLHKLFFFKGVGSDSLNYTYPYLCDVARQVWKYGIPGWSFHFGMGHDLFPFCLQDPFNILLYAAGKTHIMELMAYKEYIKVVLTGMIFFYYLRQLKLSDVFCVAGCLMYAFSGFMIVGSCWNIFSFEAMNMALLLLAFEQLFSGKKGYLFPIAVFLFGISQPFNIYLYGVFIATYAILRLLQTKTLSITSLGRVYGKLAFLTVIGILLSGPFLLANVAQMLNSPRGSGMSSQVGALHAVPVFGVANKFELGTGLMRFFSSDMAGTGKFYNGFFNYLEVPAFYCGLPCLLLLPQLFYSLEKKIRIPFLVFLLFWLIPLFFPYARYVLWLFSGDYYRGYALFVAFVFIFYSLLSLEAIVKGGKINYVLLTISLIIISFLLLYRFAPANELLNYPERGWRYRPVFLFVCASLTVYTLWLLSARSSERRYPSYVFVILVAIEVTFLSSVTVNNMDAISAGDAKARKGYNDHTLEALDNLQKTDHTFYRIDKGYSSTFSRFFSYNDGMAQGYNGTCCYNSFNQLSYVRYMRLMGISHTEHENESRWVVGTLHRPLLESVNSVKYLLTKDFRLPFWRTQYDMIAKFGDVWLLKNKYALPLGYTYDHVIFESVYDKLTPEQKDVAGLRACVLDDRDYKVNLPIFQLKDAAATGNFNEEDAKDSGQATESFTPDIYRRYIDELKTDTLIISRFEDKIITGTIDSKKNKLMYLSVPFDAAWHLAVDGKRGGKLMVFGGMTGVMLPAGHHVIELNCRPGYLGKGVILSIFGFLLYLITIFYRKK